MECLKGVSAILISTMFSETEKQYYDRQFSLAGLGAEGQLRLKNASILVIGAGGLGCPALLYLAAAGVGKLGIIDFDKVEISNLHRQVLFNILDVGKSKSKVAAEKLILLNPSIQVEAYDEALTTDNVLRLMADYDLVIDGSDNFPTRYLVNDACVLLGKPWVFGAIFRYEGQVSVFNYEEGPTYRCLYPDPPGAGEIPNCEEAGVLGVLPGVIGTLMATEAIKVIVGLGEVLRGEMLMYDALKSFFLSYNFDADPLMRAMKGLRAEYGGICSPNLQFSDINYDELTTLLAAKNPTLLIDVREEYEYERFNIGGVNWPLKTLAQNLPEMTRYSTLIFCCQSGVRSKSAIDIVQENLKNIKIYNLRHGLNSVIA